MQIVKHLCHHAQLIRLELHVKVKQMIAQLT